MVSAAWLRLEGPEKLTGTARYIADLTRPGMHFAGLVLSPHARAQISSINAGRALELPGVTAVLTAADLGVDGLLADGEVRYAGQPVAVVVADDEGVVAPAIEAVSVDYVPLPGVVDPVAAMAADAPRVRPDVAPKSSLPPELSPNVTEVIHHQRGDVDAIWPQCDFVLEDTYLSPRVHQGYLEPQGCIAEPRPDGGLTIWSATQGLFYTRQVTAELLKLPAAMIRIVPVTIGGAFGGKLAVTEPLIAQVARLVGRPIRLVLSRAQDFLVTEPGPQHATTLKIGALADGTLKALAATIICEAGSAPGSQLGTAALMIGSTYRIPHLHITAYEVLTNKVPVGAYRAPGAPQAFFALESHIDRVARALSLDPIALRLRHAVREGDVRCDGRIWPSIGLAQCLERLRDHPQRKRLERANVSAGRIRAGVGVAIGGWPGGVQPAAANLRLNSDGSLDIIVGAVDLTGTHTTFARIAGAVLDLAPGQIRVTTLDTDAAPVAGIAGGSKITYTVGKAVQAAAEQLKQQIINAAAAWLEAAPDDLELRAGQVAVRGAPARAVSLAALARTALELGGGHEWLSATGHSGIDQQAPGFAAHLARVEVDTETGSVRVTDYLAVQDVGKALHLAEIHGQIHGAIAQGIGRALSEQLLYDDGGQLVTTTLADYLLPTSMEIPNITIDLVEVPTPHGPWGARGVGEPPVVPCAAAIANAIAAAIGVRMTSLPFSPASVQHAFRQMVQQSAILDAD